MASFKSHYLVSQICQYLGKLIFCLKPSSSYIYVSRVQKVVLFNLNILTKGHNYGRVEVSGGLFGYAF